MAHDAVGATREAVALLTAAAQRLRSEYGDTLGVRRLMSDVDRLKADLDELGHPAPGHHPVVNRDDLVEIPDDTYDDSMWHDAQSEAQHAP